MEKLLAGDYASSIRNRKIAHMFKEFGLIEKYGTGIRRIREGFADYGLPEPRFEEIGYPAIKSATFGLPCVLM